MTRLKSNEGLKLRGKTSDGDKNITKTVKVVF